MENIELENKTENKTKTLGRGLVVSIVILSILAGGVSGFGSAWYLLRGNPIHGLVEERTLVQEDSAIINVVKQASPAVVSVIISKNLAQNQNNNTFNNPFFDPFFQFGIPQPQQQNNTQPQYQQTGAGSGFFVSADGMILTNKHVVTDPDAKYSVITKDGKEYDAKVIAQDPVNDIAILKIDISNAAFLELADSAQIEIGQRVIAIGNSLGQFSNTVTTGIVSGIGRSIVAGGEGISEQLQGLIQTDAAINPGNSGGPLLNADGKVIAMNTAIAQQGESIGFAIPSNDIKKDLDNYKNVGKIIQPFVGIRYVLITPAIKQQNNLSADNGAWVTFDGHNPAVVPGSPADKAGIKDGDIIIALNGENIDQNHPLAELIKNYNPGDTVTMQVLREGKTITLGVTLTERK